MFVEALSGSSGGSNIKYGEIGSYSSNTEFTIQTGLTAIDKFVLETENPTQATRRSILVYDADFSTTQYAYNYLGSSQSSNASNFNVRNTYVPTIKSISGGDITILTGGSVAISKGFWFAE